MDHKFDKHASKSNNGGGWNGTQEANTCPTFVLSKEEEN